MNLTSGKDILLQAPTGSGKSLVYLSAAIQLAARAALRAMMASEESTNKLTSMVLVPNRELGEQVHSVARKLLTYHKDLSVTALLGGLRSRKEDMEMLKNFRPSILVATPGRLCHHIEKTRNFRSSLDCVEFLVLDEADYLIHQGINSQLEQIFSCLPRNKRTALVSATVTDDLERFATQMFRPNTDFLRLGDAATRDLRLQVPENLTQTAVICESTKILAALFAVMKTSSKAKSLVFFPTAQVADFAYKIFKEKLRLPVRVLHGRLNVTERMREMKAFAGEQNSILFTTDIASRGIDFSNINVVVQVLVPQSAEQYVHRVGRTARKGESGRSVLIVAKEEHVFLSNLTRAAGFSLPIYEVEDPEFGSTASLKEFESAVSFWSSSDPELIALAALTAKSLHGYYETGVGRMNKISGSQIRKLADSFIQSAGGQSSI